MRLLDSSLAAVAAMCRPSTASLAGPLLVLSTAVTAAENEPDDGSSARGPLCGPAAPGTVLFDGFEAHACETLIIDQSPWEPWGGDRAYGELARVACGHGWDPPAFEGSQYLAMIGDEHASDTQFILRRFCGVAGGKWTLRIHQYVPSTACIWSLGPVHLYLFNEVSSYQHSVWLEMRSEGGSERGTVRSRPEGAELPLVTDAWVPIEVEIDFDENWQTILYNGSVLSQKPWTEDGVLELRAIGLFGALCEPWHYYDALTLESAADCPEDLDGSRAVDFGDVLVVLQNWGPVPTGKLTASDGEAGDQFGTALAVDGDRALVGARYAAGYDQANAGAVYAYRWDGSGWAFEEKLTAGPDEQSGAQFGISLALSGDRLLVGARAEDNDRGAAYMFRWDGSRWAEERKLRADDGASGDYFGFAVALSGDRAVVGAYLDDNEHGRNAGAAYAFRYDRSEWPQVQKLTASDAEPGDRLGHDVALCGSWAFVGARTEDGRGTDAGAAYVFLWDGSEFNQTQKLHAPDGAAGDSFSHPVALGGSTAVLGAAGDDNGQGTDAGAAYVFRWDGVNWAYEQKLTAGEEGAAGDAFGTTIALGVDEAMIGAHLDDDENMGADAGSAYVFRRDGSEWIRTRKLTAADGASGDLFGCAAAMRGHAALVGAREAASAGAVYLVSITGAGDVDADGVVGFSDILRILGAWGPCP